MTKTFIRQSMIGSTRKNLRGQSMTEFLLISSFAAVALFSMPAITEYALKRMQTVSAARMVAWQRTAWLPTGVITDDERRGVSGAVSKDDNDMAQDVKRHILRNRKNIGESVHSDVNAEFAGNAGQIAENTAVVVKTSAVNPPVVTDVMDTIISGVRKAQLLLGSNPYSKSLGDFTFWSAGYLKNEVTVTHNIGSFTLFPTANIKEQVTMLTEPWNAGGTIREEGKIQGLVPMKLLDLPFYQQLRSGLHQTAYAIKWAFPTFDINDLLFGFTPGDAFERSPLDRFEWVEPTPTDKQDKYSNFRWYRAYPPTPVINSLP